MFWLTFNSFRFGVYDGKSINANLSVFVVKSNKSNFYIFDKYYK